MKTLQYEDMETRKTWQCSDIDNVITHHHIWNGQDNDMEDMIMRLHIIHVWTNYEIFRFYFRFMFLILSCCMFSLLVRICFPIFSTFSMSPCVHVSKSGYMGASNFWFWSGLYRKKIHKKYSECGIRISSL